MLIRFLAKLATAVALIHAASGPLEAFAGGPLVSDAQPVHPFIPGRVLVRFKGDSSTPFSGAAQIRYTDLLSREQIVASQFVASTGAVIVPVAPGREMSTVLALRADPTVEFAEVDGKVKAEADPNDPLFSTQSWNLQAIRAPAAWDAVWESQGPTVAVVDSGVDLTHPDLEGRLVGGYDFVDGDDQPWDEYGHGTHMAGIIAASANNGIGVAGISRAGRVMPVRVLDSAGDGSVSALASGIFWAVDHGAKIVNLSVAGPQGGTVLREAVQYARDKGVLVVAAAGNSYQQGNPPVYPAYYEEVLAVAATNSEGSHASYSSAGSYVALAAPGGDPEGGQDRNPLHFITSTYARQRGPAYAAMAGTSQATAHVSGVAAVVWTASPSLTSTQVRSILQSTAADLGTPSRDNLYGFGMVDAVEAVRAARQTQGWAVRAFLPQVFKGGAGASFP